MRNDRVYTLITSKRFVIRNLQIITHHTIWEEEKKRYTHTTIRSLRTLFSSFFFLIFNNNRINNNELDLIQKVAPTTGSNLE